MKRSPSLFLFISYLINLRHHSFANDYILQNHDFQRNIRINSGAINMLYYGDKEAQANYKEVQENYQNKLNKIMRGEQHQETPQEPINPLKPQSFNIPQEQSVQQITYTPLQKWFSGSPFVYTVGLRSNRRISNYAQSGHAATRNIWFMN